jgi:uncharacterized protein
MATSLYDMSVASYLQTLAGVGHVLQRGFDHFTDTNTDPNEIVETRLHDDMLPFRFQIWSVAHHSIGAIEGVKKGVFHPPAALPELDYAGLQKVVADATEALTKLSANEVNAFEGKDVAFQFGDFKMPFTAETFVMSFSLPNFYFHATTAYDILRTKGVPLGKRDFMGKLRMKV